MLQLIYLSTTADAGDRAALQDIGSESSANNSRDEVTGILVRERGHYLQVLEGPRALVEDAFLRIIQDDRHHSLTVLSRRQLTRREFGEWSLATPEQPSDVRAAIEHVRDVLQAAGAHTLPLLEQVWPKGERSAAAG